ncbi:DUF2169 domain-containing protein [Candidatus Electrothrix aarhusensis]
MWAIENHTPFAAERCWVRDKNGAEVWLVAVRATFDIYPDGLIEIAKEQGEVCMAPQYTGEPGQSSLLYESDLHHCKAATDVLLHGHAYGPQGREVRHVNVRMQVGRMSKTLRVFGDRSWDKGLMGGMNISGPQPFSKMPITWERAFGGADQKSSNPKKHSWEPRNLIGTGFAAEEDHAVGDQLPNIEDPARLISSWKDRPVPAGFGPVPGNWQPRLALAGTYDKKWEEEKQPLLPDDFDERFYQCAPEDQQIPGYLHGGEPVELHNLTPQGLLKFKLPTVKLNCTTRFARESIPHEASLHSVILEPDHPRLIMVWHTHLPCHHQVLKLEKTIITDKEITLPCCH